MVTHRLLIHRPGLTGWQLTGIVAVRVAGLILLVTVIVLIVRFLPRRADRRALAGPAGASPEQILDERFARGEIDAEEYENRRRVLQNSPHR